jgi:hypothetical protein
MNGGCYSITLSRPHKRRQRLSCELTITKADREQRVHGTSETPPWH